VPKDLELLVRASLGMLLNERGEVSVERVLSEVGMSLRRPSRDAIVATLQSLRARCLVDWSGPDDLTGVEVVRVAPPGGRTHVRAGKVASEPNAVVVRA
jgi:hypothetical protein